MISDVKPGEIWRWANENYDIEETWLIIGKSSTVTHGFKVFVGMSLDGYGIGDVHFSEGNRNFWRKLA